MGGGWNDLDTGLFTVNPNNKYQVSIRVKVQNPGANTVVQPMVIYYHGDGITTFNKSCIAESIQPYIDYSNQKNVPIFMGEYGLTNWCFKELKKVSDGTTYTNVGNLGGEQYMDDILSIINDNKLNSSYWAYIGYSTEDWGIYSAAGNVVSTGSDWKIYVNEALENAFTKYFVDQAQAPQFFTTSGKDIISPTGEPFTIRSIGMFNDVTWQPSWRRSWRSKPRSCGPNRK